MNLFSDEYFMQEAYLLAQEAAMQGEIPVGAVVVSNNRIIARSNNQTERLTDVTAHAEILAITAAANHLGAKYLTDCTLYVTLEPCIMCAGALFWSQVSRIVIGAADPKRGYKRIQPNLLHPKTEVTYGILEDPCRDLLLNFFSKLRT